jgi:hypothetical protein
MRLLEKVGLEQKKMNQDSFDSLDLLKIFNIFVTQKMKTNTESYRNITVPNYFWWWFSIFSKMTQ